jgi:hypothetical protein
LGVDETTEVTWMKNNSSVTHTNAYFHIISQNLQSYRNDKAVRSLLLLNNFGRSFRFLLSPPLLL